MAEPAKKQRERRNRIPKPHLDDPRRGSFSDSPSFKKSLEDYKNEKVIFSWKFFDKNHEAFNCGGAEASWFLNLMETMKNISEMTLMEYLVCRGKPLRVHSHKWNEVAYTYSHLQGEDLTQIENDTTQFALSTSGGRVHGFIIENLLFIVWLDPEHNLYPGKNDPRLLSPPLTCYERLLCEHKELQDAHENLKNEHDILETQLLECWDKIK